MKNMIIHLKHRNTDPLRCGHILLLHPNEYLAILPLRLRRNQI